MPVEQKCCARVLDRRGQRLDAVDQGPVVTLGEADQYGSHVRGGEQLLQNGHQRGDVAERLRREIKPWHRRDRGRFLRRHFGTVC